MKANNFNESVSIQITTVENRCVPIADSFVHELGSDSAINTSTDGTNDSSFGSTDISDARDLLPDELFLEINVSVPLVIPEYERDYHCPVCSAPADAENKARDHCFAPWAVSDFGMKLDAINRLRVVSDGSKRCILCSTDDVEIFGKILELISVRHPDLVSRTSVR